MLKQRTICINNLRAKRRICQNDFETFEMPTQFNWNLDEIAKQNTIVSMAFTRLDFELLQRRDVLKAFLDASYEKKCPYIWTCDPLLSNYQIGRFPSKKACLNNHQLITTGANFPANSCKSCCLNFGLNLWSASLEWEHFLTRWT